jgi:hypothetical protein
MTWRREENIKIEFTEVQWRYQWGWDIPLPDGAVCLGIITISDGRYFQQGALICFEDGSFAQGNAGVLRMLEPGKLHCFNDAINEVIGRQGENGR